VTIESEPKPFRRAGVLLINLGTPDAPDTSSVRRYLREFLHDPKVIDINPVGRWLLIEGAILPTRPRKSAEAYQKVWTEAGSPLRVHSEALTAAVQARLGADVPVELGMQYGNPSIASGLQRLQARGVERVVVAPLFPQFATSSTGSSLEKLYRAAGALWPMPSLMTLPPFFDHPGFLDAFAQVARPQLDGFHPDHVLFSFHGLPERHMRRVDVSGAHCLQASGCCDRIVEANRYCYRAQCFATARGLSQRLKLTTEGHTVSFQSRLGRTPWIKPYTDVVFGELAKRGVKRLAVMCPAFVADCLETLEEIGLRGAEQWKAEGGEALHLVTSLNATGPWVDALGSMLAPMLEAFLPQGAAPAGA
jgi:ferrochelatase